MFQKYQRLWILMVTTVTGITLIFMNTPLGNTIVGVKDSMTPMLLGITQHQQKNTTAQYHLNTRLSEFYGYTKSVLPPELPLVDKYIIYRCRKHCGGLADRQKGVVTAYLVSQMLRRKFGIIMNLGCDFSKFVIPNKVNWMIKYEAVTGKTNGSKHNLDTYELGIQMRDGDLEKIFDKNVMYYQGNIDFVPLLMNKTSFRSVTWARNESLQSIYKIAFAHLFKLAPKTIVKFEEFNRKIINSSLCCAHLRMGKSQTLPGDMNRKVKPNIMSMITFLKGKMTPSSKLFIATDSEGVRRKLKNAFPAQFTEIGGKIVHIDRYVGSLNCSGMEKAILDQFILTKCDTLIISQSGFSQLAAILRGTDDRLYMSVSRNISVQSHLSLT